METTVIIICCCSSRTDTLLLYIEVSGGTEAHWSCASSEVETCSGFPLLGEESHTPSSSIFLFLSSKESCTNLNRANVLSCAFWKANWVSQAWKTPCFSHRNPPKETVNKIFRQLSSIVRGLNDYCFPYTGEEQLPDTMQGYWKPVVTETPGPFEPHHMRNSYVTVQLWATSSATALRSTWVKQSHFYIILI